VYAVWLFVVLYVIQEDFVKKFCSLVVSCILLCLAVQALAAPEPPVMSIDTSGTSIVISWSTVDDATGYRLYYAPYPFVGEETIGNVDMLEETATSFLLWEGAAYYLTVTAYDGDQNESVYSNIEYFIMGPPTPEWVDDDGDGYTENQGDCDDTVTAINPDAEEVCEDGVDQNCDGIDEACSIFPNPIVNFCTYPRLDVCAMYYFPVCGLLNNGERQIYSNDCVACADLNVTGYIQIQECQ